MKQKPSKQLLKDKYGDEQVFVVPHFILAGIDNKFTPSIDPTKSIWGKFDSVGKYIFRYDAEYNPEFQQLIPYILVQHPNKDKYYVARRIKGEERLIDKISLGFGGHINECDGTKDVVFKALFRELYEELFIDPLDAAKFIGYIRDLASETNDHTGLVFVVQASEVTIKEHENLEGVWMTVDELEEHYFKFENWGKYVIDYLVAHKNI